jgi:Predicted dioxygenase
MFLSTPLLLNELEQKYSYIQFLDAAHEQEHSLEVHLPFLQKVLSDFTLIPLLIGNAEPKQVEEVLNELWAR